MTNNIHSYGLYRLKIEIKNLIKQILKIQPKLIRDTDYIDEIYEGIRKEKFKNLDSFSTPRDYLFDIPHIYPDGRIRYSLLNNKLVARKTNQVAFMILEIIEGIMRKTSCEYVIELGSGGGKNLLWFASQYKDIKFIGLELNKTSVDLANTAAKKFNINNVEFHQCDLTNTEEYKKFLTKKTFIYSHHTLEEMPRIYKIPLNEINFRLPDLVSRSKNLLHAKINSPDDELIFAIILKNFSDRQIYLEKKIIEFIINRIERSYRKISEFIYKIDEISLKKKKPINLKTIKEIL